MESRHRILHGKIGADTRSRARDINEGQMFAPLLGSVMVDLEGTQRARAVVIDGQARVPGLGVRRIQARVLVLRRHLIISFTVSFSIRPACEGNALDGYADECCGNPPP